MASQASGSSFFFFLLDWNVHFSIAPHVVALTSDSDFDYGGAGQATGTHVDYLVINHKNSLCVMKTKEFLTIQAWGGEKKLHTCHSSFLALLQGE